MERIRDLLPEALEQGEAVISNNAVVTSSTPSESSESSAAPSALRQSTDSFSHEKLTSEDAPDAVWQKAGQLLAQQLDLQIYTAWIKPLKLAAVEFPDTETRETINAIIVAPNKFCCEHVSRHYGSVISEILAALLGAGTVDLTFKVSTIHQSLKTEKQRVTHNKGVKSAKVAGSAAPKSSPQREEAGYSATNLNPKYNFSNFVVGGCNQFAHAVSLQVAENLGSNYNPLFVYGGVGLGKTHLANAIGNAARRRKKKVLLISSESFVTELISSLRSNNMERFKNKFRSLDLLVVDDIQFIIGKERTQEEFFHTFNELYNRHKQIIVTCDKVPQELTGLEERLRTRFACGVSADLQAPDFETRVAILDKKAQGYSLPLPKQVAELLAEQIDTNVRELEGALNRLHAMCAMQKCEATLDLAAEVIKSISPSVKKEITTDLIQKVVAERYNVSMHDILGKRRTHNIAFARQVAMYLCREHTGCSYPELGALFGGRDHSTVIHARKVIADKISRDASFQDELRSIQTSLTNAC